MHKETYARASSVEKEALRMEKKLNEINIQELEYFGVVMKGGLGSVSMGKPSTEK